MRLRLKYFCFARNVSFDLIIYAQVGLTLLLFIIFYIVFHGMRTTQAQQYQFRHHLTSAHQYPRTSNSSVSNTLHIRSAVSTESHIRFSASTARHIRSSVSITHRLCSAKSSKCRRAPRPATMDFDGQVLAALWSIVGFYLGVMKN